MLTLITLESFVTQLIEWSQYIRLLTCWNYPSAIDHDTGENLTEFNKFTHFIMVTIRLNSYVDLCISLHIYRQKNHRCVENDRTSSVENSGGCETLNMRKAHWDTFWLDNTLSLSEFREDNPSGSSEHLAGSKRTWAAFSSPSNEISPLEISGGSVWAGSGSEFGEFSSWKYFKDAISIENHEQSLSISLILLQIFLFGSMPRIDIILVNWNENMSESL
jgi:hypothetical protein